MSPYPTQTAEPLSIFVVGAGICGLTAAIALSKNGHFVEVFEKSQFARPIGAAVALAPNGTRILRSVGFDFSRAKACMIDRFEGYDGATHEFLFGRDFHCEDVNQEPPFISLHRIDLHNELLRLASQECKGQLKLHLDSAVEGLFEDGNMHIRVSGKGKRTADLIICADGLRSKMRETVLGRNDRLEDPKIDIFRLLVPTKKIMEESSLHTLMHWKSHGITVLADPDETIERHLVWYRCRDGELQNFGGAVPARRDDESDLDPKVSVIQDFGHFHPDIVRLLRLADEVKRHPLLFHEPLRKWTRANAILVGDAAHPMLPFGAQGANQALEDAGALAVLLGTTVTASGLQDRLVLFERIRIQRAIIIQILSTVRVGQERNVSKVLLQFVDDLAHVPKNSEERWNHVLEHDVIGEAERVLLQYERHSCKANYARRC